MSLSSFFPLKFLFICLFICLFVCLFIHTKKIHKLVSLLFLAIPMRSMFTEEFVVSS